MLADRPTIVQERAITRLSRKVNVEVFIPENRWQANKTIFDLIGRLKVKRSINRKLNPAK